MDANLLNLFLNTEDDNQGTNNNPLTEMLPAIIPGLLSTLIGDPEMLGETLRNAVSKYKPVIYIVLEELLTCYEDLANNERAFKTQAAMKYNAYSAYIDAGFSSEQAMLLMLDSDAARRSFLRQITTSVSKTSMNS